MNDKEGIFPFVVLYDRVQKSQTIVKAFMSKSKITCLNYGPFDNGYVLVGMDNGVLLGFDAITM